MKTENEQNAATAPTEAAQQNLIEKPSLQKQIEYCNQTIIEAQVDRDAVLEIDDQPQEDKDAFEKSMNEMIAMYRAICENLIACRNAEELERREANVERREAQANLVRLINMATCNMPVDDDFVEVRNRIKEEAQEIYAKFPELKRDSDLKLFGLEVTNG